MSSPGLVARRARTQAGLLAAVLAVLVAGSTLAGLCTLLLTTAREAALVAAVRDAPAEDLRLTVAFRVTPDEDAPGDPGHDTDPRDPDGPVAVASDAATRMLAPLGSSLSTWLTSPVLPVGRAGAAGAAGDAGERQTYLVAADDVAAHARLVEGQWPDGRTDDAWQVALPAAAATALGARAGDVLDLGPVDDGGPRVVVAGIFEPTRPGTGPWERDLLGGAGYDPAWVAPGSGSDGAPTLGPLVVDAAALGSAVPVERASLWLTPDLSRATPGTLADARANLVRVDSELTRLLTGDATFVVAASGLSRTLARAGTQQDVTDGVVLVVGLVTFALAVAALGLAGRLLLVRRARLAALLVARGARRAQLVGQAAGEAVLLAVVGGALAVPLARAAYGALLRAPALAQAGLDDAAPTAGGLVVACVSASAFLAVALVAPWLRPGDRARRRTSRGRRGAVRSGLDVAVLALAVAAYLQLRRHLVGGGGGADPILVAAPVVCLVAGSLVALRVVPLVERLAERHAARSRRLVLPLAEWQVARRSHSAGVAFLLLLATAAATFGVAFDATWGASQRDQADARVGADLAVLAAADRLPTGAEVAEATGGEPVPVSVAQIGLSADVAGRGPGATLVAFDTRQAGGLLRGRLPSGGSWSELTSGMAPQPAPGIGLERADGAGVTLVGSTDRDDVDVAVLPSLVLEDAWGARSVVEGEPVPMDGAEHPLVVREGWAGEVELSDGPTQLVAVELEIQVDFFVRQETTGSTALDVEIRLPADGATDRPAWEVRQTDAGSPWFSEGSVRVGPRALAASGSLNVGAMWGGPTLVLTPFPPVETTPLAVTTDIADALGLSLGQSFAVDVAGVRIVGEVAHVVPYLPAAQTGSAILLDAEALARALLLGGVVEPLTDRWWVAVDDPPAAAHRLEEAGLGTVQTREDVVATLRDGPLRVGVRAALAVLVVAAIGLALAGTGLDSAAALEARAVEVARLQGLGVSRRATLATLVAEHAAVTTVVVAAGGAVGAVVARLVGPLLAVTETGHAPVPGAVPVWPWPLQAAVGGVLLLGSAAVALPAAWALVRRAAAEHLRVGDP